MSDWEKDTFLARWLSGELSEEERKSFETSEEYAQFKAITDTLDQVEAPTYDQSAAFEELHSRIADSKSHPKLKGKVIPLFAQYAVAASIFIVACLTVYVNLIAEQIIEVTADSNQEISLPDGSSLMLQKGSYAKYNESNFEDKREVNLSGEAFFEVEKGESFEVVLANGKVSVLGTSFNILQKDSSLKVSCYTGKVKVEGYGKSQIITAGQSVNLSAVDALEVQNEILQNPLWIDSTASFKNVKLKEVISQFSAYYDVQVSGDYDTTLRYTGKFPINDLEVSLEQLFGPFDLSYSLDSNSVQILNE